MNLACECKTSLQTLHLEYDRLSSKRKRVYGPESFSAGWRDRHVPRGTQPRRPWGPLNGGMALESAENTYLEDWLLVAKGFLAPTKRSRRKECGTWIGSPQSHPEIFSISGRSRAPIQRITCFAPI